MISSRVSRFAVENLPSWVETLFQDDVDCLETEKNLGFSKISFCRRELNGLALHTYTTDNTTTLPWNELRAIVSHIYSSTAEYYSTKQNYFPTRYWNLIPRINDVLHEDLTTYYVFNMGRYEAMSRWGGCKDGTCQTSTAVGCPGNNLSVSCLFSSTPPRHLENPAQIPAYHYSKAYGPLPPCFSRATLTSILGQDILLVGGTSSVRGEASVHPGDYPTQMTETLNNLASLVESAWHKTQEGPLQGKPLEKFGHVTAYVVNPAHIETTRSKLIDVMPNVSSVQIMQSNICRPELMVEIEGSVNMSS